MSSKYFSLKSTHINTLTQPTQIYDTQSHSCSDFCRGCYRERSLRTVWRSRLTKQITINTCEILPSHGAVECTYNRAWMSRERSSGNLYLTKRARAYRSITRMSYFVTDLSWQPSMSLISFGKFSSAPRMSHVDSFI